MPPRHILFHSEWAAKRGALTALALLFSVSAWAVPQQASPPKIDTPQAATSNQSEDSISKQKDKKGATEASPTGKSLGTHVRPTVTILTPVESVDFSGYVERFWTAVKRQWYAGMPESARKGVIGKVGDAPALESSSGKEALDQAALAAIRNASPFEPLPDAFHGPYIRLRVIFLYNLSADAALK